MFKKGLLFGLVICALLAIVMYGESHYKKQGTVVDVNGEVITIEDNNGNLWEFKGDGYSINQKVTMNMYTNNTDNYRYDDIVKGVK